MAHIVQILNWATGPELFFVSLCECIEGRGLRSPSPQVTGPQVVYRMNKNFASVQYILLPSLPS
jgi:hypothetical protein